MQNYSWSDIDRCLFEIRQAEAAVRDRCDFGDYLWLQDWREELELLAADPASILYTHIMARTPAIEDPDNEHPAKIPT